MTVLSSSAPWFSLRSLRRPDARGIGLLLTLLLHGIGLWLLVMREPAVLLPPTAGNESTITYVAPLAAVTPPARVTPPPAVPKPPAKKPPVKKPETRPRTAAPVRRAPPRTPSPNNPSPALAAREPLTPAPNIAPRQDVAPAAPADDFSSRIEAARKRRAEDSAQTSAAPAETESQRANRIAKENIAFQQKGQGGQRDQSGGMFQLKRVSVHTAQFTFRGWNANFRRNSLQEFNVDQGNEEDIEIAVVKRISQIIRGLNTDEFVFESNRLGRNITLNANMAYDAELRAFLLKEFFPNYVRTARR